jgi:hypothetical protein
MAIKDLLRCPVCAEDGHFTTHEGIYVVNVTPMQAAVINTGHAAAGTRMANRKPAIYTQ